MNTVYDETTVKQRTGFFGPAKVLSFDKKYKTALLQIQNDEEEFNTLAKLAVPNCPALIPEDTVLAAGNDINNLFIIGILSHPDYNDPTKDKLTTKDGAYVYLHRNNNDEKINVCNRNGEIVLEYEPKTGNSRMNIQSGDLEFITHDGNINFISKQNINFKSSQSIVMESLGDIRMSVINILGKIISSLTFKQRKIKMNSSELSLTTLRTNIQSENMNYLGSRFSATIQQSKLKIGRIETIANDIICKAKNIYNTVDELAQFKAGRIRTLIRSSLHIKAKNSYLKSENDFKINGEKIHLG